MLILMAHSHCDVTTPYGYKHCVQYVVCADSAEALSVSSTSSVSRCRVVVGPCRGGGDLSRGADGHASGVGRQE